MHSRSQMNLRMAPHKARQGTRLAGEPVDFTFDRRKITAMRGDTAASALLAAGVRLMGRSVKYRRARGVLSADFEEPNALFAVGGPESVVPNLPAPVLAVKTGMIITSQNRWPTLRYDLSALLQLGGGLLGAGFYYKTFIWPSWSAYEGLIRRLAGLGPAPRASKLPQPLVEHLTCDVLIAGAGPAGLTAALAAARAGARVVLCERDVTCGGELEIEAATIDGVTGAAWIATTLDELRARKVRVLMETAIVGGSGGLVIGLMQAGGMPAADALYRIRPRSLVIAMGSTERPIAFADNDRPGVMLLGAAERYLARYGVHVGQDVVLFGNHDRLYAAAGRLFGRGIRVMTVVDTRAQLHAAATQGLRAELVRSGVNCLLGHAVLGTVGGTALAAVQVAPLADPNAARTLPCDALLVSGGWSPSIHAGLHEGGTAAYAPATASFNATTQPSGRLVSGAANGKLELAEVLIDGHAAGVAAAQAAGARADPGPAPVGRADAAANLEPFWRCPAPLAKEKRQFVDLQNDVTVADLRQAIAEGFTHIEHAKRYTTLGVGTDQGRYGAVLGAAIMGELLGQRVPQVGVFRTRPPFQPVTLMALTGHRFADHLRPTRRTPLHDWHEAHGGVLESADLWLRPRHYRSNGEDAFSAGLIEAARVRAHGGIFDGSTLGKIEVAGVDAAAFLDRMYLNRASTLQVGRSKYMVALREDGMVLDDGILLRLADDRFVATTSSSHAQLVVSHFELWRDTEWAIRRVTLTDVTEAWSVIVCAGPQSRSTLRTVLGAEWRAALDGLRHMEFASGEWHGGALRLLRASFSGELAYELHCRAQIAASLWEALAHGGLNPYGLEALDILRVEKGYLTGAELNGQTAPADLGFERWLEADNPCVGRDLLVRPAFAQTDRPMLVGLKAADGSARFLGGAQLTATDDKRCARGHVTSSVYSPALKQWIGLALLARDLAHEGAILLARDPLHDLETSVRVTASVHFDPAGERLKS
jgi:methylglutamate dehydrogenase subunit C